MNWYPLFTVAVFLLWLGATERDRHALNVVLAATLVSWALVAFVTPHFTGPWKLAIPGALETVTIIALLHAPSKSTYFQAVAVLFAWLSHLLCFADLQLGTDMIYSRYEAVLATVAALQIVFFHDTYTHYFRRFGRWIGGLGAGRLGAVRASGVSVAVAHRTSNSGR